MLLPEATVNDAHLTPEQRLYNIKTQLQQHIHSQLGLLGETKTPILAVR
jgi:hypothetical protein